MLQYYTIYSTMSITNIQYKLLKGKKPVKNQLKAVVLAAGKGTRLHTDEIDAPKVMREACGKPLLWYVLDAISFIEKKDTILIVGYKKDSVINYFNNYPYAIQKEQLGTGHAVMAAEEELENYEGELLVCNGDMPAIKSDVYRQLVQTHKDENNDCTILTGESSLKMSFGKVERDTAGKFKALVEERDCTPNQLKITELNTGIYIFNKPKLFNALKELKNDNAQGEYYITDVPSIMLKNGEKIGIYKNNLGDDIIGINTVEHLEMVEKILNGHSL